MHVVHSGNRRVFLKRKLLYVLENQGDEGARFYRSEMKQNLAGEEDSLALQQAGVELQRYTLIDRSQVPLIFVQGSSGPVCSDENHQS